METITKTGTVKSVKANSVMVSIKSCSACHECAARNICQMSESTDKEISVNVINPQNFAIGEEVNLSIGSDMGLKAVFLGYVYPLILFLLTVIILNIYEFDDFYSGICGIFILIPYYLGVFLLKNKIKSKFQFNISKKTSSEDAE